MKTLEIIQFRTRAAGPPHRARACLKVRTVRTFTIAAAVAFTVDITGPLANNVFVEPEELKALRTRLKLTQAQLAKKLKVDVATISRWERGTRKIHNPEEMALRAIEKESP